MGKDPQETASRWCHGADLLATTGDQRFLGVENVARNQANRAAVRDHAADRVQPGLPHGFHKVKVRHVSLDASNIDANGPDYRRQPRITAPCYEDVRALMHTLLRRRQANAAIAASNESHFSFQLPHMFSFDAALSTDIA
jgi:hypothetical protein